MTTEEREAFADAVDRVKARDNADDPDLHATPVPRWWRDDPAAPPSAAPEPPAGSGPHPGTPEGAESDPGPILRRVWLDSWGWPCVTREAAESDPPVAEAVLVTPAAADVIAEAVALVTGWQAGTAVDGRELTAAVAAMQAGPSPEASPPSARVECRCGVPIVHASPDGYGADGCDDPTPAEVGPIVEAAQRWAVSISMAETEQEAELLAALAAAGTANLAPTSSRLATPAAPEPVDGPGWDRGNVQSIIEAIELASHDPDGGPPHMALEGADELRALLADRDQGWALLAKVERKWLAQATRATDSEIRAAEVRAERDRYREHSVKLNAISWKTAAALGDVPPDVERIEGRPIEQADRLIAEVDRLRRLVSELDARRASARVNLYQLREELMAARSEVDRLRVLVGEEGQPGWDGCSRAVAIRQADEKHRYAMRMADALDDVKRQLEDVREECEQAKSDREAVLRNQEWAAGEHARELAEVTADRESMRRSYVSIESQMHEARAEVSSREAELTAARSEVDEYRQVFELGWSRTQEATELWRAESPEERGLTQPDLGVLLSWLIQRGDTARRDGAADALEWAHRQHDPDVDVKLTDWAGEIRLGIRPIPSPASGEDSTDDPTHSTATEGDAR
jgi:hypothetical protein